MKITIEIDGVEVPSQSGTNTARAQEVAAPEAQGAASAGLDEVYARAAAMGAIDAGPASVGETAARGTEGGQTSVGAPQAYVGGGVTPQTTDQSGGAAPQFESRPGNA